MGEKKPKKIRLSTSAITQNMLKPTVQIFCAVKGFFFYRSADLGYGTILTMGWGFVPCRALAVLSHLGGWAVNPPEDDRIAASQTISLGKH